MKNQPSLFSSLFSILWLASMLSAVWSGLTHLPQVWRYGLIHSSNWSPSVAHYYSAAALLFLETYALRCGVFRVAAPTA